MQTGQKPTPYRGARTMRTDGLIVDVPLQVTRIVNHCYQPDLEYPAAEEIELEDGSTVTHVRWLIERRCPNGKMACGIWRDHYEMGLDMALLPCEGAPVPNEIIRLPGGKEELFEEVETLEAIRQALQTEIYPQEAKA